MIGSGRCHGPNCTREARAGDWCSEQCAAAWEKQFWSASPRPEPHPTQADLTAALAVVEQVRQESERNRRVVLCSEADEERVRAATGSMLLGGFLDVQVSEFAPPGRVIVMNPSALGLAPPVADSAEVRVESVFSSVPDDVAAAFGGPDESLGATKQQVASEDPQVGFLSKWINRLFGRTT